MPRAQLLVYRFGPDAGFEGQLVGALERIEAGGSMRILDALFVSRDAETGEIQAVALRGDGAGGVVAPLLGFRLDPSERRRATRKALATPAGAAIEELAATLDAGDAIAAVLVQHVWAEALEDAVARVGGTAVASEFVSERALGDLGPELVAAAQPGG